VGESCWFGWPDYSSTMGEIGVKYIADNKLGKRKTEIGGIMYINCKVESLKELVLCQEK